MKRVIPITTRTLLAIILACAMMPVFPGLARAEEVVAADSISDVVVSPSTPSVNEAPADTGQENNAVTENSPISETEVPVATGEQDGEKQVLADDALSSVAGFVYLDKATLEVGATQQVAVALDDEAAQLRFAELRYRDGVGTKMTVQASACAGNAARFEVVATIEGEYHLTSMTYEVEGAEGTRSVDLEASAPKSCTFSVAARVPTAPVSEEQSVDGVAVYALSENGDMQKADSIDEAVSSTIATDSVVAALSAAPLASSRAAAADSPGGLFVVALDPGHGGPDGGASANDLVEKNLNWKIAQYCKTALEAYSGVSVMVTRTEDENPTLTARVQRAVKAGARVFVSIHLNSAGSSATGAEVWYPNNSSFNKQETHGEGGELAQKILDKLVALGLTDRGTKVRDYFEQDDPDYSDPDGYYPDGSEADYYGVIREARKHALPSIIVEHAFVTNAHDAQLLAQESFLEKLGRADAAGIVEMYGLNQDNAWVEFDGHWMYKVNGQFVKNTWVRSMGDWYWLDANGYAVTGWQSVNNVWYYFDTDFAMHIGWLEEGGNPYWLAASGALQTGWFTIEDVPYYAASNGVIATGWVSDGSHWRYYDPRAAVGWKSIDNVWYHFSSQGAMQTGWYSDGSSWYYLASNGAMVTGVFSDGSHWYCADSSGRMQTGWYNDGTNWYLLAASGVMQTGWYSDGRSWYYLGSDGKLAVGWYSDGYHWYYADASGRMQTGWCSDGYYWYMLASSGAMQTGWYSDGSSWYYLAPSGKMAIGWYSDGYNWYCADNSGRMRTGWYSDGIDWYLLSSSGAMQTGWYSDGSAWYYLASSGKMQTGWVFSDNAYWYLDASGKCIESKKQTLEPVMGAAGVTASRLTTAYNRSGSTYPAADLRAGGASTINDFARIVYDEAVAEGVKPEVVFFQIMKETGWLAFGGDVKIGQFNFAGLGATGGGAAGNSFPDVKTGVRAQVQHLKAYASTEALNNTCVDERFKYVARGSATNVQWLGIQENPQGKGWATAKNYGIDLVALINDYLG